MDTEQKQAEWKRLVVEFHQCTDLIIAGFMAKGELVCPLGGRNQWLQELVAANDAVRQIWDSPDECPAVDAGHCGQFMFIPVCSRSLDKGYVSVGPFSKELYYSLHRRPITIVPHLLRLLRSIHVHNLTQCTVHPSHRNRTCCLHIQRALDYINDHYTEIVTLHQVTASLGLNRSYLNTLFRTETETTFCQCQNRFRMEQSKECLKHTDKSICVMPLTSAIQARATTHLFSDDMWVRHRFHIAGDGCPVKLMRKRFANRRRRRRATGRFENRRSVTNVSRSLYYLYPSAGRTGSSLCLISALPNPPQRPVAL